MKKVFSLLFLSYGICIYNVRAEVIVQNLDLVVAATADEEMSEVGFDFDLDGTDDFTFQTQAFSPAYNGYKGYFGSYVNNEIVCPDYLDVTVYENGDAIGPAVTGWYNSTDDYDPWGFFYASRLAYRFGTPAPGAPIGNFVNVSNKYIGVRFKIDAEWHYGYAEVSNNVDVYPGTMTFHRIAYNDVPNEEIVTGQFVAVDEIDQDKNPFTIYPNPASNMVYFNFEQEPGFELNIYTLTGERVVRMENGSERKLDISYLNPGIYIVHLQTVKGQNYQCKFTKI